MIYNRVAKDPQPPKPGHPIRDPPPWYDEIFQYHDGRADRLPEFAWDAALAPDYRFLAPGNARLELIRTDHS